MFQKRFFMCFLFLFLITSFSFSNQNYGLLDSAKVLGAKEKITGAQMDLKEMFMCNFWDFYTPQNNVDVRPIFYKQDWEKYGWLSIPSFSFYFFDAYGLKNGFEFSYKLNISTPSLNQQNICGPSFFIDLNIKKSLLSNQFMFIAYKFSWAIGYNAYPGIDIGIKNMVLFTTNTEKINFTFIPFLQDTLIFGISYYGSYLPYVLKNSPILSIEPGLELNWDINITEKFIFKVGLTTKYEVNFDLFQGTNAQGNLSMALSFGWLGKYELGENGLIKKKKSIMDDIDLKELE
ncbi:MAG TPA: hypothetical protein PK771_13100 [Spirochaetota bacterium]|nr:hypothetical protein [Spirochaetota bacterium]